MTTIKGTRSIVIKRRKPRLKMTPIRIRRKAGWDKGPVLTKETEYKVEQEKI